MRINTPIFLALVIVLVTLGTPLRQPGQHTTKPPVTIPLEVTSFGGIVLQARINNSHPMSFYLDSGASFPFVINVNRAKELGLKLYGHLSREGGAGPNTYEASQTSGLTIALENKTFTNQPASVLSLRVIEEQFGRTVDGLVGLDLFLNYVVEIDYEGKELKLYNPEGYVYSGAGDSVLLTLRDGHFFVPAKIDIPNRGELTGRFLLDTGGCMMTVILTSPFARRNSLPSPKQRTILDRSVAGLGGETSLRVTRATNFTVGSSIVSAPLIYISEDRGGALASSEYEGLIGSEILTRFKVIFDYQRRRLILERNAHFAEPLEYDMSGMSLRAYGADFRIFKIYQVLEDSPAARAGLRVGDVIEGIDDAPASRLTLDQILKMMKVEAREYRLKIKRGNESHVVRINSRRLI